MKIYVVRATQGEYSDRDEWVVKAFENEATARAFVEGATKKVREVEARLLAKRGKYTTGNAAAEGVADLFTGESAPTGGAPTSFFVSACDFVPMHDQQIRSQQVSR